MKWKVAVCEKPEELETMLNNLELGGWNVYDVISTSSDEMFQVVVLAQRYD